MTWRSGCGCCRTRSTAQGVWSSVQFRARPQVVGVSGIHIGGCPAALQVYTPGDVSACPTRPKGLSFGVINIDNTLRIVAHPSFSRMAAAVCEEATGTVLDSNVPICCALGKPIYPLDPSSFRRTFGTSSLPPQPCPRCFRRKKWNLTGRDVRLSSYCQVV